MIEEIKAFNKTFVEEKQYLPFQTSKYPDRKLAIVTCMDTRLIELLPCALGIRNGDAKIIKNAGGVITHPFGSVVRSLLIAAYELGVEEILVIGHTDCGVQHMNAKDMLAKMKARGVDAHVMDSLRYCGIDFDSWLEGFDDGKQSVLQSVELLKKHPLLPADVRIYGCMMDSVTGELQVLTPEGTTL